MTTDDYRRALDAAVKEYEALGTQRQQIDKRLSELAQTISTLSRLCGLTPTVPWGLTDACRVVLRSGLPMTPTDVRDRLHSIGVDLSKYSSELAAIHTVLKRLNESGEVRYLVGGPRQGAYLWQKPATAAALGPEIAEYVRREVKPGSAASGKAGSPKRERRR
ncbi:MAG TPA: hypothetical protein VFJ02_11960 [Vicinamibacterales bacterium]|nr:hypothetical protein [Vicinamibacterales bacterium]